MAAEDELQTRLNNRMYGAPQTRPDERRQYLGSLRERVALLVTNQEMPTSLEQTRLVLQNYQHQADYTVLLNGKLDPEALAPYLKVCQDADLAFTLINDDTASLDAEAPGLLLVNAEAIDQADIRLKKPEAPTEKKRGFFDLFG